MKDSKTKVVGREKEFNRIQACLTAGRNVLLEGAVGVGKTHLALAVAKGLGTKVFRIDGDSRYSEQKLSGWFDPPAALKYGFKEKSFVPGPLVEAMKSGGVLFINELNRLPEGVQNVLLPAIDERIILVPRLGQIAAKPGFRVIATQNPKEFVATSHLSEAILDRFELVVLDYQSEAEEIEIVSAYVPGKGEDLKTLVRAAVALGRWTREHPRFRRGASIRAAIAVAEIGAVFLREKMPLEEAFYEAVLIALPTRVEIEIDSESTKSTQEDIEALLREMSRDILQKSGLNEKKKLT